MGGCGGSKLGWSRVKVKGRVKVRVRVRVIARVKAFGLEHLKQN